jgi:hypothetical protein
MSRRRGAAAHRARLARLSADSGSVVQPPVSFQSSSFNQNQFFPPISSHNQLSQDTSSHTVEGIGHFRTRAEARTYNTQHSVRGTKVDRQLNAGIGGTIYMSRRQKEKGQVAIPVVSQALKPREPRRKKLVLSKPPETVAETRRKKMKKVMLNMLLQARRKVWEQWMEWQTIHTKKYGPNARLSKVNQLNEKVLALNHTNATHHDLPGGGLRSGDIVIFTCIEAPVDGPMRPMHVIEPNYVSKKKRVVLLLGVVDGGKAAKASQQRRGHGNEAMIPITFWTREPIFQLDEYELSVHEQFVRKAKTYGTFLLDNVKITDDLEFPEERLKRPKGWSYGCNEEELAMLNAQNNDDDSEDEESEEDDDFVSSVQKSRWLFKTVLVPDSNVHSRRSWKYQSMKRGVVTLHHIQLRWAWATYTRQIRRQRRADSRDGAATIIQQYTRAYQGRMLARHLYRRAVRRDRRMMRSRRRVARMARYELKQRMNKRDYRKV